MDGSVRVAVVGLVSTLFVCSGCFSAGEVDSEEDAAGLSPEQDAAGPADTDDSMDGCQPAERGTEICDGMDNDCDGQVDEEFRTGSCTVGQGACQREGTFECVSESKAECNVEPAESGDEVCGDGVDNDCDGQVDEDNASDAATWYADSDGDGFGNSEETTTACQQPDGYVDDEEDCDDGDPEVYPRSFYLDQDEDGYTTSETETVCNGEESPEGYAGSQSSLVDCDDTDDTINPGASEVCDGNDTNCDGTVDNIPQNSAEGTMWYVDCDGDGYAPDTQDRLRTCGKPVQAELQNICNASTADWTDRDPTVSGQADCNDAVPEAHPDQTSWFEDPMTGVTDVEQWDYNCDGEVTRRYTRGTSCDGTGSVPECKSTGVGSFGVEGGWVGGDNPGIECGQTAEYWDCRRECCLDGCATKECSTCTDNSTMKTQKCR